MSGKDNPHIAVIKINNISACLLFIPIPFPFAILTLHINITSIVYLIDQKTLSHLGILILNTP